jgi:hypothetical protein
MLAIAMAAAKPVFLLEIDGVEAWITNLGDPDPVRLA